MPELVAEGRAYNKPRWGQQFSQLPAAGNVTPESVIEEQIRSGRKQIYDKYNLQWKEINRSKRFVGQGKAKRMQQEIFAEAKQEMLQFNQKAQQQMTQLQNVDRLVQVGALTERQGAKTKIQETMGRDVAERMYPEPQKEPSIPEQFGKLDVYSHRISDELEGFQMIRERIPTWRGRAGKVGWPIMPKEKTKQVLYKMDYGLPSGKKDEFGDPIMGKLRKADEQEIQTYDFWSGIEKQVKEYKTELVGQVDVRRRIVQPGTTGGTFDDKIAESVRPQPTRKPAPKVIRQRNTRTGKERISYDGGRSWQTSG